MDSVTRKLSQEEESMSAGVLGNTKVMVEKLVDTGVAMTGKEASLLEERIEESKKEYTGTSQVVEKLTPMVVSEVCDFPQPLSRRYPSSLTIIWCERHEDVSYLAF